MTTDKETGEPPESYMVSGFRPVRELRADLEVSILEPNGDRTQVTELLTESDDEKTGRISVDDLRR